MRRHDSPQGLESGHNNQIEDNPGGAGLSEQHEAEEQLSESEHESEKKELTPAQEDLIGYLLADYDILAECLWRDMTDETNTSQFSRSFRKIFGNDEFSGENILRYTPHDLLWVISEKWEIHSHWIESYLCGEFEKYTANRHLTEEKANLYNECEEQITKKINELAERLSHIVRCYWPEPIRDKSQESQAAPKDAIAEDLRARTLRCYQSLQGIAFSDLGPDSRVRTTFPPDEVLTRLGQWTEPMVAELESLAAKSGQRHEPSIYSLGHKLYNERNGL